jgi:hypothetical protein
MIERYRSIRQVTLALAAPLSAEDCAIQSMPDASPVKWHLAHTTWFFETFVLEPHLSRYRLFEPAFRVLFNSYYNAVGDKHPRPQRGMLSRPGIEEVLAYRRHVDEAMLGLLAEDRLPAGLDGLIELGLHHEQQHQELILTDIKHLLSRNPLKPAYRKEWTFACASACEPQWIGLGGSQCARLSRELFRGRSVLAQAYGDVWEWTRSECAPYPGFRAAAGAVGEYNGKFMCNQYVLRGGSCATPATHIRATYRNFFPPEARWQFSGLRLARDA